MKRWEYKVQYSLERDPLGLATMGAQGWELISVVNEYTFYFKREIINDN